MTTAKQKLLLKYLFLIIVSFLLFSNVELLTPDFMLGSVIVGYILATVILILLSYWVLKNKLGVLIVLCLAILLTYKFPDIQFYYFNRQSDTNVNYADLESQFTLQLEQWKLKKCDVFEANITEYWIDTLIYNGRDKMVVFVNTTYAENVYLNKISNYYGGIKDQSRWTFFPISAIAMDKGTTRYEMKIENKWFLLEQNYYLPGTLFLNPFFWTLKNRASNRCLN